MESLLGRRRSIAVLGALAAGTAIAACSSPAAPTAPPTRPTESARPPVDVGKPSQQPAAPPGGASPAAAGATPAAAAPKPASGTTEIQFFYPIAVGGPITRIVDGYAEAFAKATPSIKVSSRKAAYETAALKAHAEKTPQALVARDQRLVAGKELSGHSDLQLQQILGLGVQAAIAGTHRASAWSTRSRARSGLAARTWLGDERLALSAIVAMTIWKQSGYLMIFYLAGLQGLGRELYQAAELDGAGAWARLRYLTLPLLSGTTLFVVTVAITATVQLVDPLFIMTQGGPNDATRLWLYHVYETTFRFRDHGQASAMTVLFLAVVLAATFANFAVYDRRAHYDD